MKRLKLSKSGYKSGRRRKMSKIDLDGIKRDMSHFLYFYLTQSMSLEEMDEWARRLQKKWNLLLQLETHTYKEETEDE